MSGRGFDGATAIIVSSTQRASWAVGQPKCCNVPRWSGPVVSVTEEILIVMHEGVLTEGSVMDHIFHDTRDICQRRVGGQRETKGQLSPDFPMTCCRLALFVQYNVLLLFIWI